MSVRVYIPSSAVGLRSLLDQGRLGPPPMPAHTVTGAVREELAGEGEEEWEYAVLMAAAQDSIGMLARDGAAIRVVVVAEVPYVEPGSPKKWPEELSEEPSEVVVAHPVALSTVLAVHVDSDDALEAVAFARSVWQRAARGEPEAVRAVRRCLDHDLGWYAVQELAELVDSWSRRPAGGPT